MLRYNKRTKNPMEKFSFLLNLYQITFREPDPSRHPENSFGGEPFLSSRFE